MDGEVSGGGGAPRLRRPGKGASADEWAAYLRQVEDDGKRARERQRETERMVKSELKRAEKAEERARRDAERAAHDRFLYTLGGELLRAMPAALARAEDGHVYADWTRIDLAEVRAMLSRHRDALSEVEPRPLPPMEAAERTEGFIAAERAERQEGRR